MTAVEPVTDLPRHPAKWTPVILDRIEAIVAGVVAAGPYLSGPVRVLDPFAGVSEGVHRFARRWPDEVETVGVELEPEWCVQPGTVQGNATTLPDEWAEGFDVVATSPCYGNRMADKHEARDACGTCAGSGCRARGCKGAALHTFAPGTDRIDDDHRRCSTCKGEGLSMRHTYKHALGSPLSVGSAAGLQWADGPRGDPYRRLHVEAWAEVWRVLRPYGLFLLNVSNHVRDDREQRVVEWHLGHLLGLAGDGGRLRWRLDGIMPIETPRLGHGANGQTRVDHEFLLALRKV